MAFVKDDMTCEAEGLVQCDEFRVIDLASVTDAAICGHKEARCKV